MDASSLGHGTTVLMRDPQEAHRLMLELWHKVVKPRTLLGQELVVTVARAEDDRSVLANKFYWGILLRDISEQAKVDGQQYVAEAWHELFKRRFLGFEIKKAAVAGRKRKLVTRTLRSTARLKIRAWHRYIDQIAAMATNDLGVAFTEPPSWWS